MAYRRCRECLLEYTSREEIKVLHRRNARMDRAQPFTDAELEKLIDLFCPECLHDW